jgi:E1A-binding protein p400
LLTFSERSIEENIVKKANQKRLLGDLAIEGGNFTTAFFKKSTIRDLFEVEQSSSSATATTTATTATASTSAAGQELVIISKPVDESEAEAKEAEGVGLGAPAAKKATKAFESAIAAVEDDTDLEVKITKMFCNCKKKITKKLTTN